jgi:ketosteroid isomerase-like protein
MCGRQYNSDFALKMRKSPTVASRLTCDMSRLVTSMRHNSGLFIFLLSASLFVAQSGNPDTDKVRIFSLENAWNEAQWQKDRGALDMLLAPDLVYVEYDGSLMGKTEYMTSILSPSLHPAKIVSESMSVHVYGAFAVVYGICRENGVKKGKPYSVRMRFTDTWIRRNETWMCVASQSTLIGG